MSPSPIRPPTRSDRSGLRLLGVAPLFLLALSPFFGCGDSQVASKPQLNPPKQDGAAGRGGQGGNVTGTAGMGGSGGGQGGASGSGAADGGETPDAPVTPPGDGGSVVDAPLGPDVQDEPDALPPDAAPPPVCVANMACTVEGGGNGICRNATCAACNGQADDANCARVYGPNTICAQGRCVVQNCANSSTCPMGQLCETTARTCQACNADPQCKADPIYGRQPTLCINGRCVNGDCRDSTGCMPGKICGVNNRPNLCANCMNSQQCAADPRYRDHVCVQGSCVPGDCLTSNQCNGAKDGLICGAARANTCGACTADAQCAADVKYRTSQRTTCFVGEGADKGKCVSNACAAVNQRCPQNPATFCCQRGAQRACIAGDCCDDMQCQAGQRCVSNRCTIVGFGCDGPMGNTIFVDPTNGADNSTGSGRSGGTARADCAFRTLTRALAAAATGAIAANGTITIIGAGGMTELKTVGGSAADPVEGLPIVVPAGLNVTINTRGGSGAILLRLTRAGVAGFQIDGNATLAPAADSPINIDGLNGMGGSGIIAKSNGTVRLANLGIRNTGDHGIQVQSGTVQVGSGIQVSGAGTGTGAGVRSGLNVSGGTAQIQVNNNQPPTAFNGNTGAGISVVGTGGLEVQGVPAANLAQSSVVVSGNRTAGAEPAAVFINQQGNANAVRLQGIAVFNQPQGAGIQAVGASNLRLRGSVIVNNNVGVLLVGIPSTQGPSRIDLGAAGDPGRNVLQGVGGNVNRSGGICFDGLAAPVTTTILARENRFGAVDCAMMNTIRVAANCAGGVDLAIPANQAATLTVDTANCTPAAAAPAEPL